MTERPISPPTNKNRIDPEMPWWKKEIIAITTQPPSTFCALEKFPMPIVKSKYPTAKI